MCCYDNLRLIEETLSEKKISIIAHTMFMCDNNKRLSVIFVCSKKFNYVADDECNGRIIATEKMG